MAKPLSHLSPCTDIKVVNGRTITNSHSKFFKIAKKRVKQVKVVDNTNNSNSVLMSYFSIVSKMMIYRRKNKITYEGSEILIYVYMLFKYTGSGVTSYAVSRAYKSYNSTKSDLQGCRNKLNTLVRIGLLDKIGYSVNGAHLYIPSIKAIDGLESILQ